MDKPVREVTLLFCQLSSKGGSVSETGSQGSSSFQQKCKYDSSGQEKGMQSRRGKVKPFNTKDLLLRDKRQRMMQYSKGGPLLSIYQQRRCSFGILMANVTLL